MTFIRTHKVKTAASWLLLLAGLLALGPLAHSTSPTTRQKKQLHRTRKRQAARSVAKSRRAARHHHVARQVKSPVYTVIATTYQAVPSQTDSRPFLTADNSTIRRGYSSRQRWLAVSRDLLKQGGGRIHYGDKVRVRGVSPKLDGVYTVHDTMHRRHRHRIDILSSPREKLALSTKQVRVQLLTSASAKHLSKRAGPTNSTVSRTRRVAGRSGRGRRLSAPGGLAT